jgi:hypothetical protein
MSKTSVLAILSAAGIVLTAPLGPDAYALARAIQTGDNAQIEAFLVEHADSSLYPHAIILAANQNGRGSNGNKGDGFGGNGPGNFGNGRGKGNAGYGI